MPIYQYQCKKCGHKFEELVFGKEELKCPKCGSHELKKLPAGFSVGKNTDSSGSCPGGVCNFNCPTCNG